MNPKLLERKFFESYKSEEALRATIRETDPNKVWAKKLKDEVARVCALYGIGTEGVKTIKA